MAIAKSYQHGGNIQGFSKHIGCTEDEIIDLSSNINFVQPKISIDFNTLKISAYPNYEQLTKALSLLYKVKASKIELFNGATTAIYTLFRELNLTHCTLYAPIYLEYEKAATINNYQILYINRLKPIQEEPKENSLVVFVNPSTPDGYFYDMEALMKVWIKKKCTVIIDESFLDFTPFKSAIPYLENYDKLYILKSMTKFYASAGIRIGALLSNSKNIQAIQEKEPLWKISEFDSHYLQSALKDKTFPLLSETLHRENKEFLLKILKNSSLVKKVYPSSCNFVMIELKNCTAQILQEQLISSKIMIRDCSNFTFLNKYFVRIAIKEKEKLETFAKFL